MVKNTGGNKSKKIARKNVSYSTRDVRRATDENEMYAAVSKIFSSQRCSVIGADGKTYQCNVRGKFLKNKSGGIGDLSPGVWILIGFYDWEVRSDGSKNCDLLEIYTSVEKDKLKQIETRHLSVLMKMDGIDGNDLTFSNFNVKEESSSDDEEGKEESKVAAAAAVVNSSAATANPNSFTASFYKKETIEEQMDWLSVNVNDI
jgi:hypothetical protein